MWLPTGSVAAKTQYLEEPAIVMKDPGDIQPIAVLRPSQVVAAELRQRILSGEWNESTPLPAASVLAQRLGISRHHLREALRLLEHDGLIRIERGPTGGVSLAIPDEDAVTRILEGILARYGTPLTAMNETRSVLDAAVVSLAAERASDEDLAALEAIVEREQASDWWKAPCTEFHMAVARATHNQSLYVVVKAAWLIGAGTGAQISDRLDQVRKKPAVGKAATQAHRDVLQALTARDSTKASAIMRQHHAAMFAHYEPALRNIKIGTKR